MVLFDNAAYEYFFNPLCCKNKKIYYECILQLIEKSKSIPLLYEADARDTLVLYFRNCAYVVEDEENGGEAEAHISGRKTEMENAGAILRYFRHCGWLSEKEIGRNGDNIATVTPYCRKMIDSIERIFNRDSSAVLTNHIFSIYDILHSAFIVDHGRTHRPYSSILVPTVDSVSDLKNELLMLKDSIRSIMRMVIKMTETNELGRATKYAALALKSRAMLFAGSIAKYNEIELVDKNTGYQLCGIPATKATEYFKAAYDAAKMLEGHFSLYKKEWVADNKEAQYQNFVNMFFDDNSPENILIRQYLYPNSTHSYDCFSIPRQFMVGGYSSAVGPTLDFVEMFDGFPKDENGHIKTTENGKYMLYDNLTDLFKDAEPRLRATVILPGEQFKGEAVEMWRGIYIGPTDGGISPLIPEGTLAKYESTECKDLIVTSANGSEQTPYKLSNGEMMNPAGRSGCFYNDEASAISGFSVRKYLDPNLEASLVVLNRSAQSWIEFRYGEVLLNRAEAAMELAEAGQGESYKEDAYTCINVIRERAGATLLGNVAETTMEIVRTERRKELGFENKTWWDMKRWRTLDREQNNRIYRILMPFYADKAGKWFFDARYDEKNTRYTVDSRWYYLDIPVNIINSDGLVQNPGY